MAIPIIYNLRSVRARWVSAIVALLSIAGTVGVFLAMLAMAAGFRAALVASGSAENAIIRRAGATSEVDGAVTLDQVRVIQDSPGIARGMGQPLVSPEVIMIGAFPLKATGTEANVQVRGVSPAALQVRRNVRVVEGRFFEPGLGELVVGSRAERTYAGLELGDVVRFGGSAWKVVGILDAGGSAFDSEIWCDGLLLNQILGRPENVFQSVTARLVSPAALQELKDALSADPRMTVQVDRETDYYEKQSQAVATLISVLGWLVAAVMGVGAVFGALNTMYSTVAERSREIAVLRAVGFGAGSVVLSFVLEALLIAAVGGLLGCIAVLPLHGVTTSTLNWQTFSHLAFAFQVRPALLGSGLLFALLMGLIGGVPPAIRAARRPVSVALRE